MSLLHDRNLAFQAPFLLLLVALGIASLSGRTRHLASAACVLAMGFPLYAYFASPGTALGYGLRFGKEDWRAAAEFVRAAEPDAVILAPEYIRLAFDRYWRPPANGVVFYYGAAGADAASKLRNARRVVLVLSHTGHEEENLPAALAYDRRLVAEKYFPQQSGIRIFVYDLREETRGSDEVRK